MPGHDPLVEIPIQWALDDWEQYCFLPDISGSGLIESPARPGNCGSWNSTDCAAPAVAGC